MTGFSKRCEKDCNQLVCIHICIFHTPHLMVGYDVPHRRFLLSEELSWMIHQKAHPHLGKWWANLFTGKSRWNTAWWKSWQLFLFDENWLDDCMVHVCPSHFFELWILLKGSDKRLMRCHNIGIYKWWCHDPLREFWPRTPVQSKLNLLRLYIHFYIYIFVSIAIYPHIYIYTFISIYLHIISLEIECNGRPWICTAKDGKHLTSKR